MMRTQEADSPVKRMFVVIGAGAAGAAAGVAIGAPWPAVLAWTHAHWPLADSLIGLGVGLLAAAAWFVLRLSGYAAELSSITLSIPGIGEVEFGLTRQERGVLWRLFVELATRVTIQPLRDGEGSIGEAMVSLHDFFAIAREQLAQAPVREAAKGRNSAQVLILHVLNGELRPFLARWRPRLLTAIAGGASEASWSEAGPCRAELETMRQHVLELVWQLGGQLGVAHLDAILPARPQQTPANGGNAA
jgi:hypothetical protein